MFNADDNVQIARKQPVETFRLGVYFIKLPFGIENVLDITCNVLYFRISVYTVLNIQNIKKKNLGDSAFNRKFG